MKPVSHHKTHKIHTNKNIATEKYTDANCKEMKVKRK
jgi:hypothetical protein